MLVNNFIGIQCIGHRCQVTIRGDGFCTFILVLSVDLDHPAGRDILSFMCTLL